jgi:hypothetical protein
LNEEGELISVNKYFNSNKILVEQPYFKNHKQMLKHKNLLLRVETFGGQNFELYIS